LTDDSFKPFKPPRRKPKTSRIVKMTVSLKIDHEKCTECRMCYVACREININAVAVSPTAQHLLEIDERCIYPKCTVCLMYCPAAGSIVEADSGRSVVPPPAEVWTENLRWPRP
jgi:Pyruvate/2-oxoacid:ferredoxin oxidoreductase delta subunit